MLVIRNEEDDMKRWMAMLLAVLLTGCGAGETATSAAVEAKMKADEIRQGKQLEQQMQDQVNQALSADTANLKAAEQKAGDPAN